MDAKAKAPHRFVQAFTGRIFIAYEWRPVPEGCEDEARRLVEQGFLEIREPREAAPKTKPAAAPPAAANDMASMTYRELQALATKRGIKSIGVRKADLIEALNE